jgi:hypothetical protein
MLGLALGWLAPLFDDRGPSIQGPPPPPPPGLPAGLSSLVVALTALAILWWLVRWAARRFGAGAKHAARIGLFGAAIGNALMDLAALMQPDRPRVVEIERLREARASRPPRSSGDPDAPQRPVQREVGERAADIVRNAGWHEGA